MGNYIRTNNTRNLINDISYNRQESTNYNELETIELMSEAERTLL